MGEPMRETRDMLAVCDCGHEWLEHSPFGAQPCNWRDHANRCSCTEFRASRPSTGEPTP